MTEQLRPAFARILVCTDASEAADQMVGCVGQLRSVGAESVTLVHVLDVRDVGGLSTSLRKALLPRIEAQARSLEAAGLGVKIEVPLGTLSEEINRLASERDCALIVISSRGHSLARDIVLGGGACAVLHHAVIPVLLTRIELLEEEGGIRCRAACENLWDSVLFPTDFSDTAERAFHHLLDMAAHAKPRVTLLHVLEGTAAEAGESEARLMARQRLERMSQQLAEHGAREVDIRIERGSPTRVLLQSARTGGFSLVLMGTQGRGFLEEVFVGSVAHNVARHAPLPVLFVPATVRGHAPH